MTPLSVHDSQLPSSVAKTLNKLVDLGVEQAGKDYELANAALIAAGVSMDDLREAVRAGVAMLTTPGDEELRPRAAVIERLEERPSTTVIRLGVDVRR